MRLIADLWLGLLKSWTRMTSFIAKEVIEVIRRPGALISLIFGPFIIMGLFGVGYSGQYKPLNTILVVPQDSNLPRDTAFYQQLAGDSVNIVDITADADAATARLQRQEVDLVVVAPQNVQQQFVSGQQSDIQIKYNVLDPVRDNYARFVAYRQVQELNQAIIQQAVVQGQQYVIQTTGTQPPVQIPPEVIAAPTRADPTNIAPLSPNVIAFFAPAVLALVLQHMGVTLTALSMVRERLSGAIDVFRVAPVRTPEILVGKYLAYAFFNLAIAALTVFLVVGVLKVPMLGTQLQVATVVVLLSFASLGLGLFISTIVDSERQAVQLSMLVLLASVFFSGFVLPLDQFIAPLRIAAYALPVTHGIQLLQDYMLRGDTNSAWEVLVLAGIGVVLFILTSITLRRNMHSAEP
ncbi:MAG: ABC transporter permease [Chloroflexi bacterium]|nr:ABC transporter permease [Chloroflexota bacterium]MBV9545809.1 ABC transporter permease [Chloroflexota bacterium]